MATLETQQVDAILDGGRRRLLTLGGTALAGLALAGLTKQAVAAVTDTDILNFALNLEYLEANFYSLAVYGVTIDKLTAAQGGPVSITGGGSGTAGAVVTKPNFTPVSFASPLIQGYATETALEETKHVTFLQSVLGASAVAQPSLELYQSFVTLANTAGVTNPSPFDPFTDDQNFLLGAYIFEDVGVTAYHGAAPLISDKTTILPAAVGIHAVEAYHAGLIRTTIAGADAALYASSGTFTLSQITQQISALRTALTNTLSGGTPATDIGLTTSSVALNGSTNQYTAVTVSDDDQTTGSSPGRSTAQVLAIVTGANLNASSGYSSGLFYPNGMNGNIR